MKSTPIICLFLTLILAPAAQIWAREQPAPAEPIKPLIKTETVMFFLIYLPKQTLEIVDEIISIIIPFNLKKYFNKANQPTASSPEETPKASGEASGSAQEPDQAQKAQKPGKPKYSPKGF